MHIKHKSEEFKMPKGIPDIQNDFACLVCGEIFVNTAELNAHMSKVCPQKQP